MECGRGGIPRKPRGRACKPRELNRPKPLLVRVFRAVGWMIVAPPARPVTPEVAGSSPVAPAKSTLQIPILCCQARRASRADYTNVRSRRVETAKKGAKPGSGAFKPFLASSTPTANSAFAYTEWPEVRTASLRAARSRRHQTAADPRPPASRADPRIGMRFDGPISATEIAHAARPGSGFSRGWHLRGTHSVSQPPRVTIGPDRSTRRRCACSTGRTAPSESRTPRPDR
jgi:hypothetical protein